MAERHLPNPGAVAAVDARPHAAAAPGPTLSVFQTPRPCLKCGRDFLPPKRTDRRIADHCSYDCERALGLRASERFYRMPGTSAVMADAPPVLEPQPRIKVVPISRRVFVRRPATTRRSRFAANLIELRQAKVWRQSDVAAKIGVSANTVWLWEHDRCDPPAGKLRAIADLFDLDMDSLWRSSVVTRDGARRGREVG